MKKIVLFSLIACLGFIGSGFAGSCELATSKTGRGGDHDFIYFSNGLNGLACNKFGNKQCNPSQYAMVNGSHYVGSDAKSGFHFYKCVDGTGVLDPWIEADLSLIPTCNDGQMREYVKIAQSGSYTYMAKRNAQNNEKNGVKFAAGDVNDMCRGQNSETGNNKKVNNEKNENVNNAIDVENTSKKTKVSTSWAGELNPCEGGACAVYARGGDVEQKGCLKNSSATNFVDKWKSEGSSCDATDAKTARCFKQKNVAGDDVMSCAAKICNDDSALWLYRKSENNYQSYGLCRKQNWLQKEFCDKNHKSCGKCGGKCMLNVFEWTNGSFGKTNAFYDDKLCVCVSQNGQPNDNEKPNGDEPVVETTPDCDNPCEVRQKISVICPDGRSGLNTDKLLYKICPDDLKKLVLKSSSCPEVQRSFDACRDADCIKNLINDVNLYKELIKAVCETGTGSASGSTGNSSAGGTSASEVLAAQKKLDDFYAYAKGNRSVWKDGEGKFNTTRLASDLTAGVVLGTVGGVVSGVVIKKKQVEKGFDALHCTVGGQTVADWGDTFNVGLR